MATVIQVQSTPAFTVYPVSLPDLSPSDMSVTSYRINKTGHMFSLLLDTYTCIINTNGFLAMVISNTLDPPHVPHPSFHHSLPLTSIFN